MTYRELQIGETVQAGDERQTKSGDWIPVTYEVGQKVHDPAILRHDPFRRPEPDDE